MSEKSDIGALTEDWAETQFKGGHNDLGRWKRFGGTLDRPDPPKPTTIQTGGMPRWPWSRDEP